MDAYKTILKYNIVEIEERKSRFVGHAAPVEKESEALDFINNIKSRYRDASHNVFAYCVEEENLIQRYSDDGEPSGTAGLPVMEAIKKTELKNIAVVVTRYFGGTLLGAAGLIRAYGRCAFSAIEGAGIVEKVLCFDCEVEIGYTLLGKIKNIYKENSINITSIDYFDKVIIHSFIPSLSKDTFKHLMTEASSGSAAVKFKDSIYVAVKNSTFPPVCGGSLLR